MCQSAKLLTVVELLDLKTKEVIKKIIIQGHSDEFSALHEVFATTYAIN